MEIVWSDGVTTAYQHAILRGFCPCAHCQGHHGPVGWVPDAESMNLELTSIEPVGNYAVQFTWGDAHGTGIYTYAFLRDLAEIGESEVAFVKERSFAR